ncbi:bifunctional oligoribonuclease/PAP phosphatase NrnA [candidate division KSB1 bacterium]|nr:bifunctional oligoribonuclease/PAP phosphatase NrnA [candidate division KSB1 bacterium]
MMLRSNLWELAKEIIQNNQSFILTSHINPDGDALGSEIALAEYLRSIGKQATIVNNSPTARNYRFLDPGNEIVIFDKNTHNGILESADAFFILDISDWGRLREIGEIIQSLQKPKVCIDHHHCTNHFTEIDIIDQRASSTGEMMFDFLSFLGATFTKRISTALYTCVLTDTGSFRFSNTNSKAHIIAAKMLSNGVNPHHIYQEVYEKNSQSKMKLLGSILKNLRYECHGRLAWFNITQDMLVQAGANIWDTEGFPEIPRSIDGVEVSMMFTELEARKTKISLRSKGNTVVNTVAMKFGGGGHQFASGAVLDSPIKDANAMVLEEARQLFI